MAKLNKLYYRTSKGETKINCYTTAIPKRVVDKAGISESEIDFKVEGNKIVIIKKGA